MDMIERKSLLYKTSVEYGDYTINHAQGCSHGCNYPCYAMMMAKRFGRVKNYNEWCTPKIVVNAEELLRKELPRYKDDIKSVFFSFTTDPFMYGYEEIGDLTVRLISILNEVGVKCTVLTKGILPVKLAQLSKDNEYGITVVSLKDEFKTKYEQFSAPIQQRINSLYELHKRGCKTWVSIEPYPTPNIIDQDFSEILNSVSFVDKIIFGRLNYNSLVTKYKGYKEFYNKLSKDVVDFCELNNKDYYIKNGTLTASKPQLIKNRIDKG